MRPPTPSLPSPLTPARPTPARAPTPTPRPSSGAPDIAYAVIESPLGDVLLAVTDRGLLRLAYLYDGPEPILRELVDRVSPRLTHSPRRLAAVGRELGEYFAGQRRRFETRLDRQLMKGFGAGVLEATAAIPYGEVATYGEVARSAGRPGAARAAGGALGGNPIAIVIPCHRVVPAAGGLGGYGGRPERKRFLLELEGALARVGPW